MYEVDFLPVGDTGQSGDAIALKFTRPDNGQLAHVIVDAGFQDDGETLVRHVARWFGTTSIDLAIVTHPDGDHIGGMGTVLEELDVGTLAVHLIGQHGAACPPAADAVDDLVDIATRQGTRVVEPFSGVTGFGGVKILGPDEEWYDELVADEVTEARTGSAQRAGRVRQALRAAGDRFAEHSPRGCPVR